MDERIAYFIPRNGLLSSLGEFPKIKLLIEGKNYVPSWYNPPSRKIVEGPILYTNHTAISNKIHIQLLKESEVFRLSIFGNSTTMM